MDIQHCGLVKCGVYNQLIKKKEDITVQSAAISLDTLKGQTHPKISPHHPENVATGGFAVSKATQTVIFMTPKNKLLYSGCVCVWLVFTSYATYCFIFSIFPLPPNLYLSTCVSHSIALPSGFFSLFHAEISTLAFHENSLTAEFKIVLPAWKLHIVKILKNKLIYCLKQKIRH